MKNKIFSTILSVFLLLPISVWAVEDTVQYDNETREAIEEIANNQQLDEDKVNLDDSNQIVQNETTPYKQPISKKKIVKKFLLAMFGVVLSSLILYFGLTVYNRIRDGFPVKVNTPEGETPLTTPVDLQGAVKSFLDKTKW